MFHAGERLPRMMLEPASLAPSRRFLAEAERIEAAAWRDMLESVPPRAAHDLGVRVVYRGGPLVLLVPGVDHILFNRTLGLGDGEAARPADVEEIVALYAAHGVPRYFIHVGEAAQPKALEAWLGAAGLVRYPRRWVKLGGAIEAVPHVETSLEITRLRRDDLGRAGEILMRGFGVPLHGLPLFEGLFERPRWHLFGASEAGQLVGVAGVFVDQRTAYLAFATTLPEHRARGAQRALLERRIRTALALGCTRVVAETGEAVDGDPQHSYKNLAWAGLAPLSLRDNWARAGVRW